MFPLQEITVCGQDIKAEEIAPLGELYETTLMHLLILQEDFVVT